MLSDHLDERLRSQDARRHHVSEWGRLADARPYIVGISGDSLFLCLAETRQQRLGSKRGTPHVGAHDRRLVTAPGPFLGGGDHAGCHGLEDDVAADRHEPYVGFQEDGPIAVSYTHLTLPTIYSV